MLDHGRSWHPFQHHLGHFLRRRGDMGALISRARPRLQSCRTISPSRSRRGLPRPTYSTYSLLARPQRLPVRGLGAHWSGAANVQVQGVVEERTIRGGVRLTLASLSRRPDEKRDKRREGGRRAKCEVGDQGCPLATDVLLGILSRKKDEGNKTFRCGSAWQGWAGGQYTITLGTHPLPPGTGPAANLILERNKHTTQAGAM